MSVNVRIKQKPLFKKKINIEEIVKLSNLSYGVCDENYRLIRNEIGNHTLIYDKKKLARGIDLSLDGNDILLILSLPTCKEEIRLFYDVIEKYCNYFKTKTFIREEEQVHIKDKEKFIQYDEDGSIGGLEDLQDNIRNDKYKRLEIFGIYNPISIGTQEVDEIDCNLNRFGLFLDRLQSLDVYYAAPKVYKVENQLVGIYAVGANIPSVVPIEPYIVLNQIQGIEKWYIMVKEGKTVPYEDFIKHTQKQEYYDVNHVIVTLSDDEIDKLIKKYAQKI